ncbi:inter-alpha-trypsin inhibitor heavy chain H4-like isoform X1 [Palaemon carinicauda]|uniref:inter-alpha-trypsin inhibitor heavy chain H4-like isoform X1 n=1 Tax=Palaemon carinicauda TaxID=392227 RepID=UPI0035B695C0
MSTEGLVHGQLEIHYDVERALDTGDVQIEDGYFVHFFAPVDLQYTPKHITFLIDTSGSMEGRKIQQVKDALRHILTELNAGDTFNIIHFSDTTDRLGTMRYSGTAVRKAKKFINSLQARGGTNIDLGLKMALGRHRPPPQAHYHPNYVQACTVKGKSIGRKPNLSARPDALDHNLDHLVSGSVRPHIVILLTDGQPTSGVTQHASILRNVRERNKDKAAVFSLGFGRGADMKLLERISIQNRGTSRKIYEDEDAADQLKGFYEELSMPILLDVRFSYSDDAVVLDSVTNTHFYNYFHGAELVVAGQTVAEQPSGLRANITGQGRNGQFLVAVTDWNTVLPPDHHLLDHLHLAPTPRNFIKRLWAFQKVKDLLSIEKAAKGNHEKDIARRKALRIALEHHFVTPLTSLVVVQPDKENCKDYEDDEEEEEEEEDKHALAPYEEDLGDEDGSVSVELDPHDSIGRVFNPKSIQVLRDQNDYYDTDVEAFNDFNYVNFGSMTVANGSEQLRMPCAMLILSVVFHTVVSRVFALGIQLPIK